MKKFKVPKRKQPFFSIVKKIVSVTLWRGIEVINLAGDIPTKCIFVANHEKKIGRHELLERDTAAERHV